MSYIGYVNLWRFDFYKNVSAKHRVQNISFNQLKIKANDNYNKDEKTTTKF